MVNRKGSTRTAHRRANQRFLIECSCGHRFWRATPCNPQGLRPYNCPRWRAGDAHETRCTTTLDQMLFVAAQARQEVGN